MSTKSLLVELFVEELPPKSLRKLGDAFGAVLVATLRKLGLAPGDGQVTTFATPRRLAVLVAGVAARAADQQVEYKLVPVKVGLDANGKATVPLQKKLAQLGVAEADVAATLAHLVQKSDGKTDTLYLERTEPGVTLDKGLQEALDATIAQLPIPKVMTYQLADGWSNVRFVRPAHRLLALHGNEVVPVQALGLTAGNQTQGHRFEAKEQVLTIRDADGYAAQLAEEGAVIASFAQRRDDIARQLQQQSAAEGLQPIDDDALLDEVTSLVELPNVLQCSFEAEFLAVPQECLILTMKQNQKYFPLLDAKGKLTNRFLIVSNIRPADASAVTQGNERVVRPRLADAKFFYDQDRKKTLEARLPGLDKVVYHNKLGTQGERVGRVRALAKAIGALLSTQGVGGDALAQQADRAAQLAKADLLTDMVGEFPELQGIMGGYYARNDGEPQAIAEAVEDHYKPRFAGDELPRNDVGTAVALADKLETLVGMFGIGQLPTGDKDPFALRRHALGTIRMLVERALPVDLSQLIDAAVQVFGAAIEDPRDKLQDFFFDRLATQLRDGGSADQRGFSAQQVDAVLSLRPQRLADVERRLAAVRAFAALPEAESLAAANKRIGNILKKSDDLGDAKVNELLLKDAQEQALFAALTKVGKSARPKFDAGDYTAALSECAALKAPVDAFFDAVMVNADEPDLRKNRHALLRELHALMNRIADLSKLAG
ncbi:MAG: glycine--tRNA ligase subunit beta [Planctomycetes bacterium]|nr:glycine--tRNA ligase subunit beta [Planctomycetota bacterium]